MCLARPDAPRVALFSAVNWAGTGHQRPCTGGGGVRDEEAGSLNLPTPDPLTAGQPISGGLRFLVPYARCPFWGAR